MLLGTLLSCGARVKSNFDNRREALTSNEKVAFLLIQHDVPAGATKIGTARYGDTGFSVDCDYDSNLIKARKMARENGANIVKITKVTYPDLWSSCHRMELDFYFYDGNFIDETEVGKTPFETKLERKREYEVEIRLEGYEPYKTKLTKQFNALYIGNIVFGGIIGLVVDPITGAIYKLTPNEINAQLQQGTVFKSSKKEVYIAVSLKVDKNWQKVGQLEKL